MSEEKRTYSYQDVRKMINLLRGDTFQKSYDIVNKVYFMGTENTQDKQLSDEQLLLIQDFGETLAAQLVRSLEIFTDEFKSYKALVASFLSDIDLESSED